jgi:hypothetical protein
MRVVTGCVEAANHEALFPKKAVMREAPLAAVKDALELF